MSEENRHDDVAGRLFSDFMLDPRKTRFEVEFYSTITNKLAGGHPVTFQRLSVAFGIVSGAFVLGFVLFNMRIIYQKNLLIIPFILLVSSAIYTARQYLARVGNSSKLGYAVNYLLSGKTKGSSPEYKLRVVGYEEVSGIGVATLDNRCKVIGYTVEGNFSKTMFQGDTHFLRSKLSMLRDRLDGILEVGVLSIENTDFRNQKEYYNSFADEEGSYQHYLAKNLEYNIGVDNQFEKIEKNLLFFVLRNTEDYDKVVDRHIPRLLNNNILRKAVPLNKEEFQEFVEGF